MTSINKDRDAWLSECRTYRYALYRTWQPRLKSIMFIGLNPSTADEVEDDPTIRRCIRFARDWGYGGLVMTNLFALRATSPKDMLNHPDPVGPDNDQALLEIARECDMRLACWGSYGNHRDRDREVVGMISQLYCIGVTQAGQPRHPLYLRADSRPVPWPAWPTPDTCRPGRRVK